MKVTYSIEKPTGLYTSTHRIGDKGVGKYDKRM